MDIVKKILLESKSDNSSKLLFPWYIFIPKFEFPLNKSLKYHKLIYS